MLASKENRENSRSKSEMNLQTKFLLLNVQGGFKGRCPFVGLVFREDKSFLGEDYGKK
jgi:hypothetical protein